MEQFVAALRLLFDDGNFGLFLVGSAIGLVLGVTPSVFLAGYAVALSATIFLDPFSAVILMASMLGPVSVGGSVPSILIGVPGEPVNAATVFDGYPMAQNGEAGRALGISAASSGVGGLFGIAILALLVPFLREIGFLFGPPEVFLLIMVGLLVIVIASRSNMVKGLTAGVLGILISLVGFSPIGGTYRLNLWSQSYLLDGVPLIPFFIGLFAISETIRLAQRVTEKDRDLAKPALEGVFRGIRDVFINPICVLRSSAIGTLVGVVPGIGGAVANFVAYVITQQASKDPESFGKGNALGVVSSEAANNAKDGGALIPLFAFGIPGSSVTAVFLGSLAVHGFDLGPLFMSKHLDIVWLTIFALTFSNMLGCIVVATAAPALVQLVRTPRPYLIAIILTLATVASYIARNNILDVFQALFWGIIGYYLARLEYPMAPLIIGFILGSQAERSYIQSLQISGGNYSIFVASPLTIVLWLCFIALLAYSTRSFLKHRSRDS